MEDPIDEYRGDVPRINRYTVDLSHIAIEYGVEDAKPFTLLADNGMSIITFKVSP